MNGIGLGALTSGLLGGGGGGGPGGGVTGLASMAMPGAGTGLSALGTMGGFAGGNTSSLADRSPVNIQPVGINFGEIIQPFTGSPMNGGSGLTLPSRFGPIPDFSVIDTQNISDRYPKNSYTPYLIVGGAILGFGIIMYMARR